MPAAPRIVFVVYEGLQTLDLSGPWETLDTAGNESGRPYELLTASVDGRPIRSSSGLTLVPHRRLAEFREPHSLDTLIVVGGLGTRTALADERLIGEICRLAAGARRLGSVCSGAFLLAEAGLLDGRRAVTHWDLCELLAASYPRVEVDPDPIFIRGGDVITSAGVTAGIDLALELVAEDHGPAVALAVARHLVVYARRPGGQSQFSVQLSHQAASTPPLAELQAWIAEHLEADLSVGTLAGRLHLSERQLSRLFRAELDASPAAYVERARIERARTLIEDGAPALDRVAAECGFASAEVMRRAFQRRLGTSPRAYRERFRMDVPAGSRSAEPIRAPGP